MTVLEFKAWGKTPRFNRDIIVSEKLDGTNSAIIIEADRYVTDPEHFGAVASFEALGTAFTVGAQSRNRLIFPGKSTDNFGFAAWVRDNAEDLVHILGAGHHYGEWWGRGIARNYGLDERRFSLFDAHRYGQLIHLAKQDGWWVEHLDVVPQLYRGRMDQGVINSMIARLKLTGSQAVPGFDRPEGVVIFHTASRQVYKVLVENDELPKSLAEAA